jgi:hypothetical protein
MLEDRLGKISSALGLDGSEPASEATFPPVALSDIILQIGSKMYYTTSPHNAFNVYTLFDTNPVTTFESAASYDDATGNYTGSRSTVVDGTALLGEWIEIGADGIDLVRVSPITISPAAGLAQSQSPRTFTVAAFVGGRWVTVLMRANITDWVMSPKTFKFDTVPATIKYRLIATRVGNGVGSGQTNFTLSELEFLQAAPYIVMKTNVLEQRIADLVYKLYGVTNLEDAPP